jgi:ABC-type multidrug transport system permease subunit
MQIKADKDLLQVQERASGMYRLSAFYFARTASDLPMDFVVPIVFIIIVYFMAHLRYTAQAFFSNVFTVTFVGLVSGPLPASIDAVSFDPAGVYSMMSLMLEAWHVPTRST